MVRSWLPYRCAGFIALVCASGHAEEARMIPAEDGRIGAWLVAGPIPPKATPLVHPNRIALVKGGVAKGAPCCAFQPLNEANGVIDLAAQLKAETATGAGAIAAGVLETADALDGWLLLNADGAVSVWIDSKEVWRRSGVHQRGQSWDAIPLVLERGAHSLVLWLEQRGVPWSFAARVLDRSALEVPTGLRLRLPGTDDRDRRNLETQLLDLRLVPGIDARHYQPSLSIAFPGGVPESTDLSISVSSKRHDGSSFSEERIPFDLPARAVHGMGELHVPLHEVPATALDAEGPTRLYVDVRVGSSRRKLKLSLSRKATDTAERAKQTWAKVLAGVYPKLRAPEAVAATIDYDLRALERAGAAVGIDAAWQDAATAEIESSLDAFVTAIVGGRDPLYDGGVSTIALYSRADGNPVPLRLLVPNGAATAKRGRPLTIVLHGYNGTPKSVWDAFFYAPEAPPPPPLDGFVVAPQAFGDAFYRGPAETNLIDTLDWLTAHYPIDLDRVSITGVSMGGTGTAQAALRYPERFAAAAPLCGYHDFFIRHDVRGRRVRPWEEALFAHWSTMSWAENALGVPFYVAQGTRDFPLENSKSLVRRLQALHYDVTSDWPAIGHDVWRVSYRDGLMWKWLLHHGRSSATRSVHIKTDALRYGQRRWVKLVAFDHPGRMAELSAKLESSHEIQVTTDNVAAFELEREGAPFLSGSLGVMVDGVHLSFSADEALHLAKSSGVWRKAGELHYAKRVGVEGPIHDAFLEPLVFSYGTHDPSLTRASREVATALAKTGGGDVAYPILPDTALSDAITTSHSLVLVGNAVSHSLLGALAPALPLQLNQGDIWLGHRRFAGHDLGAIFIYPNPRSLDHYIVVVLSGTAGGIWRALSLPKLLPDFMVYDDGVAAASGQQVLAGGHARAAGFFDNQWRTPEQICDPLAPNGRCDDPP